MALVFVTGNAGKMAEARTLLGEHNVEQDSGGYVEIQADTLAEVAAAGLADVARRRAPPFFLEDAGLFVHGLSGFPGVYSAPLYHSVGCDGLLRLMAHLDGNERAAHFEAVIGYRDPKGNDHFFTGRAEGTISDAARGRHGFGFDPVFVPRAGDGRTFAELTPDEKGRLSHRGAALRALAKHVAPRPHEKTS